MPTLSVRNSLARKAPRRHQQGKLFTITGGKTFSAAAGLLISLIEHTQTALVGEPAGVSLNGAGEADRTILGVLERQGGTPARKLYEERKKMYGSLDWWQPFTQGRMNDAGCLLLESKNFDDAIAALSMNTDRSWEVWDSLGGRLMGAGRLPAAGATWWAWQVAPHA